jgi:3-oxoacyl-[acyl-carrier-protein] synthase III
MKIGFETIVDYLPAEVLNVREHYAYLEPAIGRLAKPAQDLIRAAAPDQVRRLRDATAAEIMAVAVAQKALDRSGLTAADIDALLITQTGGRQFMPLLGSYVHLNLGLKRDALVRNIVDDNVSVLDASYLAWNFVRGGLCKRVLVVAVAAQISGQTGFGVDLTDPLAQNYGDGAAAAIVSSENLKCEFLAYHFETFGAKPRITGTLNGNFGPVRPLVNPELAAAAGMEDKPGAYLEPEDPMFDEIARRKGFVAGSLARAATKAGLGLSDLDMIIAPHVGHIEQAWIEDLEAAGMSPERYQNLRKKYGNTAVADLLIDLAEFAEGGQMARDSVVALWAPCMGMQLAALILKWVG